MYAMTAAESVKSDNIVSGAPNVSGLSLRLWDKRLKILTMKRIYPDALRAFRSGFLVIEVV